MTTLFIWDDYASEANWEAFHKKYNISPSDKRAGDLEGHSALMISDSWTAPFPDAGETLAILEYYNNLQMTWQTSKQGGCEYIRAKRLMEKLGDLFSSCLADESGNYVSASSDVYGGAVRSLWHDLLRKGRVPDHIVHIPETAGQQKKMRQWWQAKRARWAEDIYFQFRDRNNCRMPARVLIEGFAGRLAFYWSLLGGLRKRWTPSDAGSLARNISRGIEGAGVLSWSGFVDGLAMKNVLPGESLSLLKNAEQVCSADFLEPVLGCGPARNVAHIFHGNFPEPEAECRGLDLEAPETHPDYVNLWPDGEPAP